MEMSSVLFQIVFKQLLQEVAHALLKDTILVNECEFHTVYWVYLVLLVRSRGLISVVFLCRGQRLQRTRMYTTGVLSVFRLSILKCLTEAGISAKSCITDTAKMVFRN